MTITILFHEEGAGEDHEVFEFTGQDEAKVVARARQKFDELALSTLRDTQSDPEDVNLYAGAEVNRNWQVCGKERHPFDLDWRTGYIHWKYRDSTDSVTITVLPRKIVEREEVL